MTDQLETAIRRFRRTDADGVSSPVTTVAFRTAVEQRLAGLERDVGELRGRINGLIFVVLGAVVTQIVLKVVQ